MASRAYLIAWLVGLMALSAPVHGEGPIGTDYLRQLPLQAPPCGAMTQDVCPYDGVRIQRWKSSQPEAEWLLVWIDLQTPGLSYRATPVFLRPGPNKQPWQSCRAQTTADFLTESSDEPHVDLAVNTVAYFPAPAYDATPVFLSEPVWHGADVSAYPEPQSPMLGLHPGRALIAEPEAMRAAAPMYAFGAFRNELDDPQAVALRDGRVVARGDDPHGRTVAGVSADGRVLILLIVDGYNPGVSIGLSLPECGAVMKAAGARDAVFLDGGGSSTLVGRNDDGAATVLNRPAGLQKRPGTLRYVAVNLGFTGLRRTAEPLPALADWRAPAEALAWEKFKTWQRVYKIELLAGLAVLIAILLAIAVRQRRRHAAAQAA